LSPGALCLLAIIKKGDITMGNLEKKEDEEEDSCICDLGHDRDIAILILSTS
jgi:hypothetical protein